MDEDQTQDVQQPEVETGNESSDVEETALETSENAGNEAISGAENEQKTVPYDRFAEVNQEAKRARQLEIEKAQLEARLQTMEQLKPQQQTQLNPEQMQKEQIKEALKPFLRELAPELGFVSQAELRQQESDRQVQQEVQSLESKYTGKDGRPKFEARAIVKYAVDNGMQGKNVLERAYKEMHESTLINWHVQQAIAKSKGLQTEGSDGSGSANAGTTNNDLKAAIVKGDRTALQTYLKRNFVNTGK